MFKDKAGNFSPFKLILTIFVVILAVIFLGSSFVVIPAGHTGVALTFGKVEDVVLQEGLHFKVPFVQKIVVVDNRIVKLDVNTEAFSKDLQTITTVVAVNYHVGKENSQTLYKNVGMGFEEVLITPAVNEVLKAVTAKYTAVELVSSRAEVSMLLDEGLNEKMNAYGIFINELNIINWDFSEEYINAVEAKQVAEQNLIKTRTEQEQALVIANTEAQKRVIAAEAEANEIKVPAQANAESNRIITESISELLIKYQTVSKWDGKLPTVMSGSDNMLIDIPLTSAAEQPVG